MKQTVSNNPFLGSTVIDTSTILTEQDLNDFRDQMLANYGQADQMFVSPFNYKGSAGVLGFNADLRPEFAGTPWAEVWRLSKHELRVAGLHTTLGKLKVLKFSLENWDDIYKLSKKRLKKAKWSRYQQPKKVQSSLSGEDNEGI